DNVLSPEKLTHTWLEDALALLFGTLMISFGIILFRQAGALTGCRVSSKRPAFICRWRGWRPIAARSRPCCLATIIRRCVPD
ncbi:hypothetical protein PXW85_27020, partial [Klebsiella pneumoniae]|nr:hypothetical protein [Klebsiella pneumoniae]